MLSRRPRKEEKLNIRSMLLISKFQTRKVRLIKMKTCSSPFKIIKNSYGIFSRVSIPNGVKNKRKNTVLLRVGSRQIG